MQISNRERKNQRKKGKKISQQKNVQENFGQLLFVSYPLSFLSHFGEKIFWQTGGECNQTPPLIFSSFLPTKHSLKTISLYFSLLPSSIKSLKTNTSLEFKSLTLIIKLLKRKEKGKSKKHHVNLNQYPAYGVTRLIT